MPQVTRIDPVFGLVGEHKLKVCAYCRVSSNSEDQLNSFAVQVKYYTKYIESHAEWELVDIFADEGITGTCADKRTEFMRMIQLCKHRKIDLILTKSISRFARNVPECLDFARKLRRQGVGIIFEKEAINTLRMSDELMLSTFSAIAQEESMAISQRLRHMNHERMKRGEYIASIPPYGYRINEEKRLVIIPEEADVVKRIFNEYLQGRSLNDITEDLERMDAPKPHSDRNWTYQAIRYIISNEKYIGDTLYQKKYSTGVLPFKLKYNRGEQEQYYVRFTHASIISREVFEAAQGLLKSRAQNRIGLPPLKPYSLTKKIHCSECGSYYVHKTAGNKSLWVCRKHLLRAEDCPSCRCSEKEIFDAFIRMFNKLQFNSRVILRNTLYQLDYVITKKRREDKAAIRINQSIAVMLEKRHAIEQLHSKGYLSEDVFQKQSREICNQIQQLKRDRDLLYDDALGDVYMKTKQVLKTIENYDGEMMSFDADIYNEIVEDTTISADRIVTFHLTGGLSFSERLTV